MQQLCDVGGVFTAGFVLVGNDDYVLAAQRPPVRPLSFPRAHR